MKHLLIILLCIHAACIYGIIHDQITARICVEYFTIGHPPIFHTTDPTLLGIGWGIFATWWVGLLLGVPLSYAALHGDAPQRSLRSLLWPIAILLIGMGVIAALAGVIGFILATGHGLILFEPLASAVPIKRHTAFITDLCIHQASYAGGFFGGAILCVKVWRSRGRDSRSEG